MRYIAFLIVGLFMMSCKKNNPISELGNTNGEFASELTVTYNNTKPAIGDTLVISASTWQRDDKFKKVNLYETVVESFGLQMTLNNGSSIITKTADESTLTVIDSIAKKSVILEVKDIDLDKYWATSTNNYVIRYPYIVKVKTGKYPNDASLINQLSDTDFSVVKGLLAYTITKADYLVFFPGSPTTHFTTGGTYALTALGMANLKQNLTKTALIANVLTLKKIGSYNLTVNVEAMTLTNTITSSTRTFDITL